MSDDTMTDLAVELRTAYFQTAAGARLNCSDAAAWERVAECVEVKNQDIRAAADHWHVLWQQNVETASAAMRERDAANAEVEKLRTEADDLKLHASNTSIEVEKLRRGGKELGRIIERQCLDVLEITGLHHMIDADGDGDWGVVWERLAEMAAAGAEAEKLRGALETIRGIATSGVQEAIVNPAKTVRSCRDILAITERIEES